MKKAILGIALLLLMAGCRPYGPESPVPAAPPVPEVDVYKKLIDVIGYESDWTRIQEKYMDIVKLTQQRFMAKVKATGLYTAETLERLEKELDKINTDALSRLKGFDGVRGTLEKEFKERIPLEEARWLLKVFVTVPGQRFLSVNNALTAVLSREFQDDVKEKEVEKYLQQKYSETFKKYLEKAEKKK
jgi:hypothetical protein